MNNLELQQVAAIIAADLNAIAARYNLAKYPPALLRHVRETFASMHCTDADIEAALVWKWGHVNKTNFPRRHRHLIAEIQGHWPAFVTSGCADSPHRTFQWWQSRLGHGRAFITVAFVTHLVHHAEPIPIIDQHTFRAMNFLIKAVRPAFPTKYKPSTWEDIMLLGSFMSSILSAMPGLDMAKLDHFLMMYGRNHVPRCRKSRCHTVLKMRIMASPPCAVLGFAPSNRQCPSP